MTILEEKELLEISGGASIVSPLKKLNLELIVHVYDENGKHVGDKILGRS